jgi:HPt (histidine-containing phosphotransfer) domain-containing protein
MDAANYQTRVTRKQAAVAKPAWACPLARRPAVPRGGLVARSPDHGVCDRLADRGSDGDRELLRRMVQLFLDQCPKLLGEVRDSVLRGDGAAVERAAHKLKATVGIFGAQKAYQAALRLEELGGAGDVTGSQQACPELEEAVRRLEGALADLVRDGGTGGS